MEVDKFIGPLIQLAPKVFALAGEAQIAIGLFSIVKNYLSGDTTSICKSILTIIRSKLSKSQCDMIIDYMKTASSVLNTVHSIQDIIDMIIQEYNDSTNTKDLLSNDNNFDRDLQEIIEIANRVCDNCIQ